VAESEREALTLATSGVWFASDLRRLVDAVEQVYGAFRVARVYVSRRSESYSRSLYPDLALLEKEFSRGRKPPSPSEIRRLRSLLAYLRPLPDELPVGGYYGWLRTNIDGLDERGRLRLARARMASPGEISFEGSGEVVEQVREFVKDVRGRNRQEREMSQLQIERERIQLQRDKLDLAREYLSTFGFVPPDVLDDLGIQALNGAAGLIELERERRLDLEAGPREPDQGGDAKPPAS
jgi:hypothetical protein